MESIFVDKVVKTYNNAQVKALNGLSFHVDKGEIFGIIGPDGAGKTSLFRILTTLLLPDSGKVIVNDYDIIKDYKKIRSCIGYMPGKFSLYQDLTVKENLQFFATIFNTNIEANYDLIKDIYVRLEPFKHRRAGDLSGGMKQKLALCCALIHKPVVLFLDEPTTGVDAISRKEFWEMLRRLKNEGITIMVSTPYMDEAMLCDRIALIQNGNILSLDKPNFIIRNYAGTLYAIKSANMYELLNDLRGYQKTLGCYTFGEYLHLTFMEESKENEDLVLQFLTDRGHAEIEIMVISPTIEDCFIQLMND